MPSVYFRLRFVANALRAVRGAESMAL